MKLQTTLAVIPAILLFSCAGTVPPPGNTGDTALQHIIDRYFQATDSIAETHPLRIGILPFIPSGARSSDSGNELGRYIAERLTSRMAGAGDRIKVFERNRLDAIFRENSLALSGIVNEKEAQKIGELAPIDYLFTGTFTVLTSRISLSGRIIDVASGEIVFAASDECTITDAIAGLLPLETMSGGPDNGIVTDTGSGDRCTDLQASLDSVVASEKPDDQLAVLINEGIKIPFDTVCPEIHLGIIERCRHARSNPPGYTDFLITTLSSIDRPDDDNRADAIFNYFRADKTIDDREWNAGCDALSKVRWVDRYLEKLIIGDTLSPVLEKRLADLSARCRRGAVGKPTVTFDDQLYHVLPGLGMFGRSSMGFRRPTPKEVRQARDALHLIEAFSSDFVWSIPEKYADLLEDLWQKERYSPFGDSLFVPMCRMVTRTSPEKNASVIGHISRTLVDDVFKCDTASSAFHRSAVRAMQQFAETCRQQIIDVAVYLDPRQLANTDIIALCLFTGIASPSIPAADSISLRLSSEDVQVSRRAAEYAVYMDRRAVVLEDKLLRLLRQRIRNGKGSESDNGLIVRALGATRTAKPEACELLLVCLDSLSHRFPRSEVVRTLARIGKPAFPFMKKYLEKDPASHAYATADFFELVGTDAKTELPYLERTARSITTIKARYYLEDAVERIRQQSP